MEYCTPEESKQRPTMLTVLAILTFIGSGFYTLVWFFLSFSTDMLPVMIETLRTMGQPEELIGIYAQLAEVPSWKFLCLSATYALAVIGAAFMMKLNKIGYHIYIVSQILLFCCSNFLMGDPFAMGFTSISWSLIFIMLYGMHYKIMKKPGEQDNDQEYNPYQNEENENN